MFMNVYTYLQYIVIHRIYMIIHYLYIIDIFHIHNMSHGIYLIKKSLSYGIQSILDNPNRGGIYLNH